MKTNFKKSVAKSFIIQEKVRSIIVLIFIIMLVFGVNSIVLSQNSVSSETKENIIHNHFMGIKNLTNEQMNSIDKLKLSHRKEMLTARNILNEKQAHLKTLSTSDKVDMNSINSTIEEIGALKTDMMKKREAYKQEIRKLLTEEQRVTFDVNFYKRKIEKHNNGKFGGFKNSERTFRNASK